MVIFESETCSVPRKKIYIKRISDCEDLPPLFLSSLCEIHCCTGHYVSQHCLSFQGRPELEGTDCEVACDPPGPGSQVSPAIARSIP